MKLIDKDALVAEIKKEIKGIYAGREYVGIPSWEEREIDGLEKAIEILNTLEVKEVGDNSLEKFKSLQHIDKDLHQTLEDWGYAPNLYHFDGSWHVDWISCEEGDSIKGFTADTAEEAINEACNWFHSTFCNG